MIVIETTSASRRWEMVRAVVGIVALIGFTAFFLSLFVLAAWISHHKFLVVSAPLLLSSICLFKMLVHAFREHRILCACPRRIIATPNTLAIQYPRRSPVFVKRTECVGVGSHGYDIVLKNGDRYPLRVQGTTFTPLDEYLDAFYRLWWPELNFSEVQVQLADAAPRPPLFRALLPGLCGLLGGIILGHVIDPRLVWVGALFWWPTWFRVLMVDLPRIEETRRSRVFWLPA